MTLITHTARRATDITTGETMNITDEMVTAACVALYRGSGDLEPTNDEMRAALAAALAVQPQPAGPVATVIKRGADRTWMSERLGGLPDGTYSLYLAAQPQPASQWLPHTYAGDCPDDLQPDARDPECPACRAMDAQPARVPQPVALPALPEPARTTPVQFGDDGQWFRADQMTAYARQCAAAWGITLADTKGGGK